MWHRSSLQSSSGARSTVYIHIHIYIKVHQPQRTRQRACHTPLTPMAEQQRSMQYRAPVAANKAAVYHTTLTPMAEQRSTQYRAPVAANKAGVCHTGIQHLPRWQSPCWSLCGGWKLRSWHVSPVNQGSHLHVPIGPAGRVGLGMLHIPPSEQSVSVLHPPPPHGTSVRCAPTPALAASVASSTSSRYMLAACKL